jgi:hypothetical protein
LPEVSQASQKHQPRAVTSGQGRPLHVSFAHNELLAQHSILDNEVRLGPGQVCQSAGSDGNCSWFGQSLELDLDTIDEGFTDIEDCGQHDFVYSNCGLLRWSRMIV